MSNAKSAFQIIIENFPKVAFDANWTNGTGYYDHAVRGKNAPKLEEGQAVKSTDNLGRKMAIVGTSLGNVIVFERFADPDSEVIVFNMPQYLKKLLHITQGDLDAATIESLLGAPGYYENIGKRLKLIKPKTFAIGSIVTCDLWDATAEKWQDVNVLCSILGGKQMDDGSVLYLVKMHGRDVVGRATVANSSADGDLPKVQLKCSAVATYENGGSLEEAVVSIF